MLCSAARMNARELATTPSFTSLGAMLVGESPEVTWTATEPVPAPE